MPDIRQIKDEVVGATKNYVDAGDAATLAAAEAYTDAAVIGLGTGDVHGPASSTGDDFAQFNGTTGKIIKDGGFKPSSFDTAGAAAAALVTAEVYTDTSIAGVNQYSDEKVDDRVSVLIQNGTGISWVYNDPAGTFTPTIFLTPFSTTNLSEGSNLYYTDERNDDRTAALIQNGTGLTWTYNDGANTLTGVVSLTPFSTTNLSEGSNLYFTDERAEDAVGGILTDTATIDFTYNDAGNTITADVKDGSITFAKMQAITDQRLLGAQGGTVVEEIAIGTGLLLSSNTLSTTITQYTDEMAEDAVGGILVDTATIDFTYNDGANIITADLKWALVMSRMWVGV